MVKIIHTVNSSLLSSEHVEYVKYINDDVHMSIMVDTRYEECKIYHLFVRKNSIWYERDNKGDQLLSENEQKIATSYLLKVVIAQFHMMEERE